MFYPSIMFSSAVCNTWTIRLLQNKAWLRDQHCGYFDSSVYCFSISFVTDVLNPLQRNYQYFLAHSLALCELIVWQALSSFKALLLSSDFILKRAWLFFSPIGSSASSEAAHQFRSFHFLFPKYLRPEQGITSFGIHSLGKDCHNFHIIKSLSERDTILISELWNMQTSNINLSR